MAISNEMIVQIAHADIALDMAFSNSIRRWQRGASSEIPWRDLPGGCDHVLVLDDQGIEIDGDCLYGISAPRGGLIHVNGNLASDVDIDGHYELVVIGDVAANATIVASGYCHVFVGGNLAGSLSVSRMARIWIGGDLTGQIQTGTPSTKVHVGGDFLGRIHPTPKHQPALLSLNVSGFASEESLTRISNCSYTEFRGSIAVSDVAPGLYPKAGYHRKGPHGNCFARWSVGSEIGLGSGEYGS